MFFKYLITVFFWGLERCDFVPYIRVVFIFKYEKGLLWNKMLEKLTDCPCCWWGFFCLYSLSLKGIFIDRFDWLVPLATAAMGWCPMYCPSENQHGLWVKVEILLRWWSFCPNKGMRQRINNKTTQYWLICLSSCFGVVCHLVIASFSIWISVGSNFPLNIGRPRFPNLCLFLWVCGWPKVFMSCCAGMPTQMVSTMVSSC